jgi:tRNA(Ile)-lysidine synthetase-like protein
MRGRGAVSCTGPSGASSPRRRPAAPSRWGHWSWSGAAGGSGWDPLALPALGPRHWDAQGSLALDELGLRLEARRFDRPADYAPPRARDRVAFDADALPETFIVRPRRRGERFAPFGGPEERRLKSLLSDAGIPRWERSRIPLLEADGRTCGSWDCGAGRMASIGPHTKRILEVTVLPL